MAKQKPFVREEQWIRLEPRRQKRGPCVGKSKGGKGTKWMIVVGRGKILLAS